MFTLIDGGFQIVIKDLLTMDFSWLFTSCLLATTNVVMIVTTLVSKVKKVIGGRKNA